MSKPIVVVTRRLPAPVETRMMELFDSRLNADDTQLSVEQMISLCDGAEILVPTVTDKINSELINQLPDSIKMIANFGVGVDHIDLDAAAHRDIVVTNTPGVLTDDTADLTIALLLAVPRRLTEGSRLARTGAWEGWTPTFMMGHRVTGKRLGVIGMGRIGQAVAKRARAFDIQIHYHNRRRVHEDIEADLEATYWKSLDQMLAHMDLVSINCPQTPETHHLLNAQRLDLLQSHAVIVNTARGGIIDEAALAERLESGAIAGAGLDVYENEPEIHPKLIELDNVVLAPHLGSATHEGRLAMGKKVVINIQTFLDGRTPPDRILTTI
ncbi:MAG: D-glycerate dehydrogenase [Rhodospirillaceae bacterium]|nr:D-glycerate dehydrogenase [Rhodospirillaceae bacterium]|tara:strand:+ start:19465 stop:20442 length:978 start_codon:yes stop_codon:yes gene_type:complete